MRLAYRAGFLLSVICAFLTSAGAQAAPRPLITQPIDETQLVTLQGNTHPLALPQFDMGTAPPDLPLNRMLLVLKRTPEQDFALRKLLDDQQDKASPNYHKWLTPDEFGQEFGPADQDLQTVTGWLQSHGFQINRVTHGRTIVEFSGVEAQVEQALHTQIHQYLVNGEEHWANATDPQIPAALAPLVAGVQALNNFRARHYSELGGIASRDKATGKVTMNPAHPLFTFPNGGCGVQPSDCYAVGPYDFATIYDVAPAWSATPAIDGTGQTVGIVGETDINPQDVADFRNFFGLPTYGQQGGPTLNIIHDGAAPGILTDGEETEADLDVEWSGGVAKGASVDFVVSETTETTLGVHLSALFIIDNNLAPVMSESYGTCELFLGTAGNQFFSALWQQAASQGITVMVSSGDGGSAGCDDFDIPGPATYGLQVSGYASTPYNVAVGGTDFNDLTNASSYWSTTNNSTTQASALSYIPETTWDDSCTNPVFGTLLGFSTNTEANCNNVQLINAGFVNIISGSGGKSGCITSDGLNASSCSGGYAKPSWQNAPGVPVDGVRDVPDVSLFAASGSPSGSFYVVCESDAVTPGTSCNASGATQFLAVGGTSASSPAFAGVMALVNQEAQSRQGNANFVLYQLAKQHPSAFHDVTTGTNEVPCQTGSLNCTTSRAGDQFGIIGGYNTGVGYDLATGMGSVDVNNLLQNWDLAKFTATTTTLHLSPTTNLTHGQAVNVTANVAPTSGSGVPTGALSLLTSTGASMGIDGFTLSGGSVSGTTNLLPGGSYSVVAQYSGDPTFASSDSMPVNVTVSKENSSTELQLIAFDFSGNLVSNNATSVVYGSPYLLRINVLNSQGNACQPNPLGEAGCPTGNVSLTDNGNALDGGSFALNSLGYTEDQSVQFPGGSQSVAANYAGDNSFNASSTNAMYTITPAPTTLTAPTAGFAQVGSSFTTSATVQAQTLGAAPGGTVTFFANGTQIAGTPSYTFSSNPSQAVASLTASLTSSVSPFSSAGKYSITATYGGDNNYGAATSAATSVSVLYPAPTIAMASPGVTIAAGQSVTVSAVVSTNLKNVPAPSGTVQFIYYPSTELVTGNTTYSAIADSNGNVALQASITFTPPASVNIAATYAGDSNYPAAQNGSGLEDVTVTGNDFALLPSVSSISLLEQRLLRSMFCRNPTITARLPSPRAPAPVFLARVVVALILPP
jgi:subtilase family serine protease